MINELYTHDAIDSGLDLAWHLSSDKLNATLLEFHHTSISMHFFLFKQLASPLPPRTVY